MATNRILVISIGKLFSSIILPTINVIGKVFSFNCPLYAEYSNFFQTSLISYDFTKFELKI